MSADQTVMRELVRRESQAYLQYIRESFPWSGRDGAEGARHIRDAAAAEYRTLQDLLKLLQKKRIALPKLGAFPAKFTDSNFVSVRFLLPKLAKAQRESVANLERELPAFTDADLRAAIQRFLDLKRQHLATFETASV